MTKMKQSHNCTACENGNHQACETLRHIYCDCWRHWHGWKRDQSGSLVKTTDTKEKS